MPRYRVGLTRVRLRLDGLAFVGCDRAPQRFGGPLDLLGVDGEPGQFVGQQGAGLLEADSGGGRRRHACRRGRQRRLVDAQGPVTRTESGSAGRAMVVGPLQGHGAQGRADRLCTPAGVAGRVSAPAGQAGGVLVTVVGVEPLGDETEPPPPGRRCAPPSRPPRSHPASASRRPPAAAGSHVSLRPPATWRSPRSAVFFCCAAGRQTRLAQGIVDLDEHLRQLPEAAILGEPRLRLRPGVGRDDACDRLAGLLRVSDRTGPCPGSPGLAQ